MRKYNRGRIIASTVLFGGLALNLLLSGGGMQRVNAAAVSQSNKISISKEESPKVHIEEGSESVSLLRDAQKASFREDYAFEMLTLINKERKAAGKSVLVMDKNLYKTAQLRAKEIVTKFSHTRPDGTGCFTAFPDTQVSMGENIAEGYYKPSSAMGAWMKSASHKSNILKSAYKSVGIACYYVPGSKYSYYWVQCFGDKVEKAIYWDGEKITNTPPAIYKGVDYAAVYDYNYYLKKYEDVAKLYTGDPDGALMHFVKHGMSEGRQGNEDFNVYYYKNRYADLRNLYGSDLKRYYKHYVKTGLRKNRDAKTPCMEPKGKLTKLNGVDYGAVFDFSYYIKKYSGVRKKFQYDDIAALEYFVTTGMKKGQQAKASFDLTSYAYANYDLRKEFKNDLPKYYMHYITTGKAEKRVATGVTKMQGGIKSYQGVKYSYVYNVGYYASHNEKLRDKYGFDDEAYIKHFIEHGMKEGLQGNSSFNPVTYMNRYEDLKLTFGDDLVKYYMHYITTGRKEGRTGK